jgi:cytochrome c-type biogenesis protein CcmH
MSHARVRWLLALVLLYIPTLFAMNVGPPLPTVEQQALFEKLNAEVRCLVCQNQTIGDSSAPLAADLRREIRAKVAAGQSEADIKLFLTDRYGDFVLYRPRYGGPAAVLWLAPAIFLLIGCIVLWKILRRRATLPTTDDTNDQVDA